MNKVLLKLEQIKACWAITAVPYSSGPEQIKTNPMNTTMASFAGNNCRTKVYAFRFSVQCTAMQAIWCRRLNHPLPIKQNTPSLKFPSRLHTAFAEPGEGFESFLKPFQNCFNILWWQHATGAAVKSCQPDGSVQRLPQYYFSKCWKRRPGYPYDPVGLLPVYIHGGSHEHDHQLLAGAMMLGLPVICYYSALNKTITGDKSWIITAVPKSWNKWSSPNPSSTWSNWACRMKMVAGYSMI